MHIEQYVYTNTGVALSLPFNQRTLEVINIGT
jgi:hypothetical protein